jgi:hypothetical protein
MGWTLNDIKKRILFYKRKLKSELNPFKRKDIKETISSLEGIIEYFNEEYEDPSISFKEVYKLDKNFIKHYHKLNPYVLDFCDTFSEEEIDFITELSTDTTITGTKIMTVTKEFYESIKDERFYKHFSDMYAKSDFYVNFKPATEANTREDTAITFNVYNSPEVFYYVKYSRNINDYLALVHEYAHGISCRMYDLNTIDFGKYPFNETDAIFFEMVLNDGLAKNEKHEIDSLVIDIDRFFDYALNAVLIEAKLNLYTLIDHNHNLTKKDIISYLKNEERLEKDSINEVLHRPMYKMFNYTMSYLVAIELFLLYRVDPKMALDALYEFINLRGKSSLEHLDMLKNKFGIVPGANTHVYFQELKARVEGMKNDKKVQYTIK